MFLKGKFLFIVYMQAFAFFDVEQFCFGLCFTKKPTDEMSFSTAGVDSPVQKGPLMKNETKKKID